MKRLISLALALCLPGAAMAQSVGNPYIVAPAPSSVTVTNGTVATANTFQSVLAANPSRRSCTITNKSTAILRVFVGAPGSATAAQSYILNAGTASTDGGSFDCGNEAGTVVTNEISVTSPTAGSAFVVASQ